MKGETGEGFLRNKRRNRRTNFSQRHDKLKFSTRGAWNTAWELKSKTVWINEKDAEN